MFQGIDPKEAVRLAKEKLGDVTAHELAAYVKEAFGLTILPPIIAVLLGTLMERAMLDQTRQAAREQIERWKAENPEEAKKLAASAKRREAVKRKKAEASNPLPPTEPPAFMEEKAPEDDGEKIVSELNETFPAAPVAPIMMETREETALGAESDADFTFSPLASGAPPG